MNKTIPNKCYIVANLPDTIIEWVTNLRERVDPAIVHMPVEITLIGSSGAGPFVEGQDFERVKSIVSECLEGMLPFEFSFRSMGRFPSKEIYFLEPEPDFFETMHEKLLESGIEFEESPFPYSPHCSIAGFTPITDETRSIIKSAGFPSGTHKISSVSIYRNENMNPIELWRYEGK